MIDRIHAQNFKSIKDLDIECRRINIFLGLPNTGKSNLIELLGFLSCCGHSAKNLKDYVRFRFMQNLFYNDFTEYPINIFLDSLELKLTFHNDQFHLSFRKKKLKNYSRSISFDYNGNAVKKYSEPNTVFIKFYRFRKMDVFPDINSVFLQPPHGSNMFSVVMGSKNFKEIMADFFAKSGFQLVMKPQGKRFEFQKQIERVVMTYPYSLASDTLQRTIFHMIAIESNKKASLVFEEPESHSFPFYTQYLAEKIATDESNQYFITTHSSRLLNTILAKAPKDSINIFITFLNNFATNVKCLSGEEFLSFTDAGLDPFLDIESILQG